MRPAFSFRFLCWWYGHFWEEVNPHEVRCRRCGKIDYQVYP